MRLIPSHSPLRPIVEAAAQRAGARFDADGDFDNPSALEGLVLIVDLGGAAPTPELSRHLGSRAIAVSPEFIDNCYEHVDPRDVQRELPRAIGRLVERETLAARVESERETVRVLNEIGHALSAHTDRQALLEDILTHSRQVLRADAGSVYIVTPDKAHLRFECAHNDTVAFDMAQVELPLDESSLAGFTACRREVLNIEDAYAIGDSAPYAFNPSFDEKTGYKTRSILLVPMLDSEGEVMGVLSLVNHKREPGAPLESWDDAHPFRDKHADLARSIASQASVAIENYRLYEEIRRLFDGFVDAAVTAIEARDPTTGGHSHRVAALTTALARAVDESSERAFASRRFSERDLTELHYAAMLHDFGKVGVPEKVLLKAEKLYPAEMSEVEARFQMAALNVLLGRLEAGGNRASADDELRQLQADLEQVRELNKPRGLRTDAERALLRRISQRWRLGERSEPVMTPLQVERLCIPRGTLDTEERLQIESHVTHTWNFLVKIPWTRDLSRVPELAGAHHEKLDGTGYPHGLSGEAIPYGARLMTIADIFDALTAKDRPYKRRLPHETALAILREEADRGRVENDALELFIVQRLWTGIVDD